MCAVLRFTSRGWGQAMTGFACAPSGVVGLHSLKSRLRRRLKISLRHWKLLVREEATFDLETLKPRNTLAILRLLLTRESLVKTRQHTKRQPRGGGQQLVSLASTSSTHQACCVTPDYRDKLLLLLRATDPIPSPIWRAKNLASVSSINWFEQAFYHLLLLIGQIYSLHWNVEDFASNATLWKYCFSPLSVFCFECFSFSYHIQFSLFYLRENICSATNCKLNISS